MFDLSALKDNFDFSINFFVYVLGEPEHSCTMPRVQYSRLPMEDSADSNKAKDSVAFDFSSVAFDFGSVHSFKSVFSYSKAVPPYINEVKGEAWSKKG